MTTIYVAFQNDICQRVCVTSIHKAVLSQCYSQCDLQATASISSGNIRNTRQESFIAICFIIIKSILIWFYLFTINLLIKEVAIISIVIWHSSLPDNYVCCDTLLHGSPLNQKESKHESCQQCIFQQQFSQHHDSWVWQIF